MVEVVTAGAITHANQNFFTGRITFLSPNQQCQSTEWKMSHSMDLLTASSPGVFHPCLCPLKAPGYLGECFQASRQPSESASKMQINYTNYSNGKGAYTWYSASSPPPSPPQKRSGMARVIKGFHSSTCTPTRSSAIGMSHIYLCLPGRSWIYLLFNVLDTVFYVMCC